MTNTNSHPDKPRQHRRRRRNNRSKKRRFVFSILLVFFLKDAPQMIAGWGFVFEKLYFLFNQPTQIERLYIPQK
jgi:hypothetical protein